GGSQTCFILAGDIDAHPVPFDEPSREELMRLFRRALAQPFTHVARWISYAVRRTPQQLAARSGVADRAIPCTANSRAGIAARRGRRFRDRSSRVGGPRVRARARATRRWYGR